MLLNSVTSKLDLFPICAQTQIAYMYSYIIMYILVVPKLP